MKRGLFFFGLGLLALAFVTGAAEIAASAVSKRTPFFMPWAQVWEVLWPDSLAALRKGFAAAQTSPWAWVWAFAEGAMVLPGWFLFGAPGFILILAFRDRSRGPDKDMVESLGLYDELAKRAHDEGYGEADEGDDMAPDPGHNIEAPDEHFADEHIEPELLSDSAEDPKAGKE